MSEENLGGEGNEGREWVESVPEFARGWGEVEQAENMEALFNRIGEQRSFLGNAIRVPSEDASEEDRSAFHNKLMEKVPELMLTPDLDDQEAVTGLLKRLGRPDDVKDYGDLEAEEVAFDEGQLDNLKGLAHELGLTKKQYKALAEKIGKDNFEAQESSKEFGLQNVNEIQEKWGLSAEAKYQETVNFAKQAGAPEVLVNALIEKNVDSDTVFWLNGLAKNLGEAANTSFAPQNSGGDVLTPDEAQEQINEILGNPNHPYHKGDGAARKKMHKLMQLKDPTKKYA